MLNSDSSEKNISTLCEINRQVEDIIRKSKFHSDQVAMEEQLIELQNEVSEFIDGNQTTEEIEKTITNIQPFLSSIIQLSGEFHRSISKRKSSIQEESFHPKKAGGSFDKLITSTSRRVSFDPRESTTFDRTDLIDTTKLDELQSVLRQSQMSVQKDTKESLTESTKSVLNALQDFKNDLILQTSEGVVFGDELEELSNELTRAVSTDNHVGSLRKSLGKSHELIDKIETFKQSMSNRLQLTKDSSDQVDNSEVDIVTNTTLDNFESVLRKTQTAIKSRKSTKKTLASSTNLILSALDEFKSQAQLNTLGGVEFKEQLDELQTELNDCIESEKPLASLRKSLAKSGKLIEKIEEFKESNKLVDLPNNDVNIPSEDLLQLEETLRNTKTTLESNKRITKVNLQDESRKLVSIITALGADAFDDGSEESELKEKLIELKDRI